MTRNTSLITEASATNINNCNGELCNSSCDDNRCPAIVKQERQQLQQQLAATASELAATASELAATASSNYLKKIGLNLQILQLNCQTSQSSCLSNLQTTLTTIQSLLPNPVPQNLQLFATFVIRLQTKYKSKPIPNQDIFPSSNQMRINMDINDLRQLWSMQQ